MEWDRTMANSLSMRSVTRRVYFTELFQEIHPQGSHPILHKSYDYWRPWSMETCSKCCFLWLDVVIETKCIHHITQYHAVMQLLVILHIRLCRLHLDCSLVGVLVIHNYVLYVFGLFIFGTCFSFVCSRTFFISLFMMIRIYELSV